MDDQKPIIDTEVKDYSESNKKNKNFTVAIILTLVFIGCFGFVLYRMNKMLGQAGHIGDPLDDSEVINEESTTTTDTSITIEEKDLDDYLVFFVTNNNSEVVDMYLYINTYVGDEINDTITKELSGLASNYKSVILVKKSELGIYDTYKYNFKFSASIYKSAQLSGLSISESKEDDSNFNLSIVNSTGSSISSLELAVLYYNGSDLVDIKTKTLYGVGDTTDVSIAKSVKEFDSTNFIYVEAYYN